MPTLARTLLAAAAGGDAVAPLRALGAEALAASRLGPPRIDGAGLDGTGPDALLAPLATALDGLLERSSLVHRLGELVASSEGWAALAWLAIAGGVALLVLRRVARRLRPTGSLSLRIEFPEAIDGSFGVRLRRRGGGRTRGQQRSGVRRETQFDGLAVGLYALELEGELRAPRSQAVLARVRDALEVRIEPDRCTELVHRLPAVEALVEFRIHWDRRPARDVGLCLDGRPQSLRYAAQGQLKTSLALGEHRLIVGAGDRVLERSVVIDGYEPKVVHMDLASPEGLVFKGCPPAVNAFLQGDLGAAARALERDGQGAVGSLLLARLHQEQGQSERAAERLENAGRWRDAAELRRGLGHHDRAARLFERAGQLREAAACHEAAESWAAAARAHQAVQAFADAARCWERAGEPRARIDALEAAGDFFTF